MIKYIIIFLIAWLLAFILTPLVRRFAEVQGIVDLPGGRKIHKNTIPLLGGIPIFLAFNLVIITGILFKYEYISKYTLKDWGFLFVCQLIILGAGIYDDIKRISPRTKFLFQILAGTLLIYSGFAIEQYTGPFSGKIVHLGILSIPVTILWVVGITNALNLIDGIDGLATGTAFIAAMTIFAISLFYQNITTAIVALVLGGTVLGFLRYNFHPAKIFLGDSGSLLLGFLLAFISVRGTHKGAVAIAIIAPILILGLPIMDTMLSMLRRLFKAINLFDYPSDKGKIRGLYFRNIAMFEADKDHIHHKLLKLGLSQKSAAWILYGATLLLGVFAFLTVAVKNINISIILLVVVFASYIGIKSLKYRDLNVLDKGLLLPIFNNPLVSKRLFQAFFDLALILGSFYLSFLLMAGNFGGVQKNLYIEIIPVVLLIKIAVFYFVGLYKGSWRHASIEDFLRILQAVFVSSLIIFLLALFVFGLKSFGGPLFFVVDLYLLLSFVGGSRLSLRICEYYFYRNNGRNDELAVIYGAGKAGSILAKELRDNIKHKVKVLGFLDDDPTKKGKRQHDYPILGTLDELEKLVTRNEIKSVIISTQKISDKNMILLREVSKKHDVVIKAFQMQITSINQSTTIQ
ncbi:MAG: hypothetical protein ABIL68_08715 [bacterium]